MDLAALLYVLAVIAIVAVPGVFMAKRYVLRRRVLCPEDGREHRIKILCRGSKEGLIPTRVKSCDAFGSSGEVDCDEECLGKIPAPIQLRRRSARSKA